MTLEDGPDTRSGALLIFTIWRSARANAAKIGASTKPMFGENGGFITVLVEAVD